MVVRTVARFLVVMGSPYRDCIPAVFVGEISTLSGTHRTDSPPEAIMSPSKQINCTNIFHRIKTESVLLWKAGTDEVNTVCQI